MALRQSVGDIAGTLLSMMHTRLELFSLEASGQTSRLFKLAGMAFAALLFLTLAVLVFSIAFALYFWPSQDRYLALGLLALLYALLGLGLFWAVRRSLLYDPMPFAATLDELRRDAAMAARLGEPSAAEDAASKDVP
ncbi:phage holin family protein [Candidimonas humi]|jgi:uncharacterized membrane protein YqjE|uniref:Phage holin family protein n=1 Tax=Candidimonas humi TaxID=683355 RepID=A0ABV8NYG1_9BURK|nr:phage holin family protein [Candidimonas humi]MBV6304710.1 phage holin family protein [Candidimonas humi]